MHDPEDHRAAKVPFDEHAATEALERLRQDIARQAARRKDATDAFERFIQSFGTAGPEPGAGSSPPRPPDPSPLPVRSPAPPVEPPRAGSQAPAVPLVIPEPSTPPLPAPEVRTSAEVVAPEDQPARRSRIPLAAVAVLLLLGLIGAVAWLRGGPDRTERAAAPVTATPVPAPAAAAPPPTPPPAAPANTASELTTTRPVWVRVVADGERVLERELPADARIPLNARETIVIRTGDAGAVRVTLRGQDQGPLGREGQVVTRTFTVPR